MHDVLKLLTMGVVGGARWCQRHVGTSCSVLPGARLCGAWPVTLRNRLEGASYHFAAAAVDREWPLAGSGLRGATSTLRV